MTEVFPGVYMVKKTWGSNVYILPGKNPALIDAGFPVDRQKIIRCLKSFPSPDGWLIVATHYHLDHTGSMKRISESFETIIAAQTKDAMVMEGTRPLESHRLTVLQNTYSRILFPLFRYQYVNVDRKLSHGDVLDALGGLEVIHLPGHTPGSVALYQRNRGILFSGDTIRNENDVLEGPPPQFSTALEESFKSIEKRILNLEFEVLLPGHGKPVIGGASEKLRAVMSGREKLED